MENIRQSYTNEPCHWLVTGDIIEVGDTVCLFYHGTAVYFRPWPQAAPGVEYRLRATNVYPVCLGLATLLRDRFAFVTPASGEPGSIVSKPIALNNKSILWLNVDVSEGATLRVEIIDVEGIAVADGQLTEDSWKTVYRRVALNQPLTDGDYRMRITMWGPARLYSFAVTKH
jgi:hypothetical protein